MKSWIEKHQLQVKYGYQALHPIFPSLFPNTKDKLDNDCSKVFRHSTENGNGVNIILFSDEKEFDVQETKMSLLECEIQDEDNLFIHMNIHTKFQVMKGSLTNKRLKGLFEYEIITYIKYMEMHMEDFD